MVPENTTALLIVSAQVCDGSTVTDESGFVNSHGLYQANNTECNFTISVGSGNVLRFFSEHFDVGMVILTL